MFFRRHKISIVTASLIAGAVLAMACQGGNSGGSGTVGQGGPPDAPKPFKKCATKIVEQPKFNKTLNIIEAKTKSECDKLPDSHFVTITLFYHPFPNDNSIKVPAFHVIANSTNPAVGLNGDPNCGDKPYPGHDTTCKLFVPNVCKRGVWKINVLVVGDMDNVPFGFPGYKVPDEQDRPQFIESCARHSK